LLSLSELKTETKAMGAGIIGTALSIGAVLSLPEPTGMVVSALIIGALIGYAVRGELA